MASFRITGRVEALGTRQFLAVASGMPETTAGHAIVLTALAPSLPEANQHKTRLMAEVSARVCARGDQVVDPRS